MLKWEFRGCRDLEGLRAPQGWIPDRESLSKKCCSPVEVAVTGLERERERQREMSHGQRPRDRTERGWMSGEAGGTGGASGAADPAEMSPQQEASHNIPVVWPGPGLPQLPRLPQLQPPFWGWGLGAAGACTEPRSIHPPGVGWGEVGVLPGPR